MKKFHILLSAIVIISSADAQWVWKNPPTTYNHLYSSYFPNASTGYVVGENGTILKTTDSGENWGIQASGTFRIFIFCFLLG
jgi:photosystem II stability/assembly factor-like uncharacterized protein